MYSITEASMAILTNSSSKRMMRTGCKMWSTILNDNEGVYQNDLEHGDTETQRFYFIDLQIYSLCVFVSPCFIYQL